MALPAVLIVGGSGYLGQFLVDGIGRSGEYQVAFTHHSSSPPPFKVPARSFKVDVTSGQGLAECFTALGTDLVAVINCAAISQPGVCEQNPTLARAVNVPTALLQALNEHYGSFTSPPPLLIHLSTDQVFDGHRAHWTENDIPNPVNEYGHSKVAAEQAVKEKWPNHVILRSSIIYGPQPPASPVGRALFLQFVQEVLAAGKSTNFFEDEWRNPIYVKDIVAVCKKLITQHRISTTGQLYHMGGPGRMSRVDMAHAVAKVFNYKSTECIVPSSAATASRGVASPADISMVSTKLEKATGLKFKTMEEALVEISDVAAAAAVNE